LPGAFPAFKGEEMKFAVFASGNGSNLQAIIRAVKARRIKADLKVVFSDKPEAYALTRARKAKVPCVAQLSPRDFSSREKFDAACVALLKQQGIELVVLAGYMRLLSPVFLKAFPNRVLNIHPALLPAFKGGHAVEDALAYGARVTGVTVHVVDEEVDHGPIILQAPVEIRSKDTAKTLAARIHRIEHLLYPKAIDLVAREKVRISGRVVRFIS
jgi:phosphoribosylglycinamide formyltransferase-1